MVNIIKRMLLAAILFSFSIYKKMRAKDKGKVLQIADRF